MNEKNPMLPSQFPKLVGKMRASLAAASMLGQNLFFSTTIAKLPKLASVKDKVGGIGSQQKFSLHIHCITKLPLAPVLTVSWPQS
jgi:hypothetical protein